MLSMRDGIKNGNISYLGSFAKVGRQKSVFKTEIVWVSGKVNLKGTVVGLWRSVAYPFDAIVNRIFFLWIFFSYGLFG